MLAKPTIIPESSGVQVPISFIPMEDGLFAVTGKTFIRFVSPIRCTFFMILIEQEDNALGVTSRPITLVHHGNFVSQPLLKTIDGNFIIQQVCAIIFNDPSIR